MKGPGEDLTENGVDVESIKKKVIEALRNVYDPEIPVNVYDLGLVYEIRIDDGPKIYVRLGLTAPGCPVAYQLVYMAEEAIRQAIPEAKDVTVELDMETPWNPERVTPEGRKLLQELFGYDVVEEWIKRYQDIYGSSGS